jgi:hypothetical protein
VTLTVGEGGGLHMRQEVKIQVFAKAEGGGGSPQSGTGSRLLLTAWLHLGFLPQASHHGDRHAVVLERLQLDTTGGANSPANSVDPCLPPDFRLESHWVRQQGGRRAHEWGVSGGGSRSGGGGGRVNVALKAAAVGRNCGDRPGEGPDEEKDREKDREKGERLALEDKRLELEDKRLELEDKRLELEDKHPPTSEGSRRASSGYHSLPSADFKYQSSKAQLHAKKTEGPAAAKLAERVQGGQLSFRDEILATGAGLS